MEFSFIAVSSVLLWTQGFYGTIETNLGLTFRWCFHVKKRNKSKRKKKKKNEEFGKHVGVMRIWMYDSINQQPAENEGVGETGGGRGGSVEIGLDFGTEVKLSSRTIGSCVPLCYLYPSIFSYSSFLCLCVWNGLSERKIHAALYSFVALVCFFCFVLFSTLTYWSPPLF